MAHATKQAADLPRSWQRAAALCTKGAHGAPPRVRVGGGGYDLGWGAGRAVCTACKAQDEGRESGSAAQNQKGDVSGMGRRGGQRPYGGSIHTDGEYSD